MALGQEERVARRYAKALFDACDPNQFDTVDTQLAELAKLWEISADFRESNLNPRITDSQRADVLEAVVASLGGWKNEQLHRTLQILVSLRKAVILPHLAALFAAYVREYRKNLAIEVSSAELVSDQEQVVMQEKLSAALGGKVSLKVQHKPELLGGITLRLGDRYLDRSIAGTLARIAGQITK